MGLEQPASDGTEPQRNSFRRFVRAELVAIYSGMTEVIGNSTIRWLNRPIKTGPGEMAFRYPAEYAWGKDDAAIESSRGRLLRRFDEWKARIQPVFSRATPQVARDFDQKCGAVRLWLSRDEMDSSVPRAVGEAQRVFQAKIRALADSVTSVFPRASVGLVLVPDTNWLIHYPSFSDYCLLDPQRPLEIRLMPQVLQELDDLKNNGRNGDIRRDARETIRCLRSLREGGRLSDGVPVGENATLSTEAREPSRNDVPSWLDFDVADDRLLASALHQQLANSGLDVALLTDDINMQNKADAIGLPWIDAPAEWERHQSG